jgi:TonB-linked SusC/RagA family outer membrane protein
MKELLLRRIPLMMILCSVLSILFPVQRANARDFQQATPLKTVLNQVASHYKVIFLFEDNLIQHKNTSYKFTPSDAGIDKVLNDVLTPLGLKMAKVDERNIAIVANAGRRSNDADEDSQRPEQANSNSRSAGADTIPERQGFKTIKGRVLNAETNEALSGASVLIPGLRQGITAGPNGEFSLSVPVNTKHIMVQFVGFDPQSVSVGNRNNIVVRLQRIVQSNSNVVVTGIITRNKESFTGATQSFKGEELKLVGNQNVIQSVKSLDPSFILNENDLVGSNPNVLPQIEIRGKTSVDNRSLRDEFTADPNQPLFILDGFETNLRTVLDLDMNRVESLTLLKDAASTAIYGARAANGVVVIETKKPSPGAMQFFYSGDFRIEAPDLNDYNMMNAAEKLEFERLSGRYTYGGTAANWPLQVILDSLYSSRLQKVRRGVDSYWLNEPLQTGFTQGHSIRAEGGDARARYGAGLQYRKQTGVMIGSGRDTWQGNLDLIYRFGKFNIQNKFFVNGFTAKESPYGSFADFVGTNPYYSKYNELGEIDKYLEIGRSRMGSTEMVVNPLYNAMLNNINTHKNFGIQNNLQLTYQIAPGIQMQGGVQVNKGSGDQVIFYPAEHSMFDNAGLFEKGSHSRRSIETFGYQANAMLTYGKLLGKIHQLNANLRAEAQESRNETYRAVAVGFPAGSNGNPAFAYGYQPEGRPQTSLSVFRRNNFLLSGSYTLDRRFVTDFSLRMDGSTAFGSNKKYTSFWSVGIGWNLHQEEMFKGKSWINTLRLKVNTGLTGNQNFSQVVSVSVYDYLSALNGFGQGVGLVTLGNPDLEWQTTRQTNLGIDFALFNNKFSGFINLFQKFTDPLIVAVDLSSSTGLVNYPLNVGNLDNRGMEFNLRYSPIYQPSRRMVWTLGVTGIIQNAKYDGIDNQLQSLNKQQLDNRSLIRFRDGYSPEDLWGVYSHGIDPATGREVFLTKEGQYSFVYDPADIRKVGNSRPNIEGVFNSSITYRGFNLGIFIRYRLGGDQFNSALFSKVENISDAALAKNQDRRALYDRWKSPGDIARFKNIGISDAGNASTASITPMSSRFIQEENSITGESVNFGYEFQDTKWLKRLGLQSLRFTGYMNDIFRISTIRRERGILYPYARSVSFSINANF